MAGTILDRSNRSKVQFGDGPPTSNTRGNIYIDESGEEFYFKYDSTWTKVSSTANPTLDEAYDSGSSITADSSPVLITTPAGSSNYNLSLVQGSGSNIAALSIEVNTGTTFGTSDFPITGESLLLRGTNQDKSISAFGDLYVGSVYSGGDTASYIRFSTLDQYSPFINIVAKKEHASYSTPTSSIINIQAVNNAAGHGELNFLSSGSSYGTYYGSISFVSDYFLAQADSIQLTTPDFYIDGTTINLNNSLFYYYLYANSVRMEMNDGVTSSYFEVTSTGAINISAEEQDLTIEAINASIDISATQITLSDDYLTASSNWVNPLPISSSSQNWDDIYTLLGNSEGSLLDVILAVTGGDFSSYVLINGTRDFTGDQSMGGHDIFGANNIFSIINDDTPGSIIYSGIDVGAEYSVGVYTTGFVTFTDNETTGPQAFLYANTDGFAMFGSGDGDVFAYIKTDADGMLFTDVNFQGSVNWVNQEILLSGTVEEVDALYTLGVPGNKSIVGGILADNTAYLRTDGTRPLNDDWSLGENNITGASYINGYADGITAYGGTMTAECSMGVDDADHPLYPWPSVHSGMQIYNTIDGNLLQAGLSCSIDFSETDPWPSMQLWASFLPDGLDVESGSIILSRFGISFADGNIYESHLWTTREILLSTYDPVSWAGVAELDALYNLGTVGEKSIFGAILAASETAVLSQYAIGVGDSDGILSGDITKLSLTSNYQLFIGNPTPVSLDTTAGSICVAGKAEFLNTSYFNITPSFGAAPTAADFTTDTITVNWSTGKPIQTVTATDDVTTFTMTDPPGVTSLWLEVTASGQDVIISGFTGVYWYGDNPDVDIVTIPDGSKASISLVYKGSSTYSGSVVVGN